MAAIEAIATTYLEADAASVTFSSIPATYEHLQLHVDWRSDWASSGSDYDHAKIQFNGDTGTNYSEHGMQGYGTTVNGWGVTGQAYASIYRGSASEADAALYGNGVVDILDYADDGNKNTTIQGTGGVTDSTSAGITFFSGLWDNTDDVTSIVLAPANGSNFVRGSEFTLYGLNSS